MKQNLLSLFLLFAFLQVGAQNLNSTSSLEELLNRVESIGTQGGSVHDFFTSSEIATLRAYYQAQNSINLNLGGATYVEEGINGLFTAYGSETAAYNQFVSFDPDNLSSLNLIAPNSGSTNFEGAGAISNDNPEVGYAINIIGQMYRINVNTGAYTLVGNTGIANINGAEFHPNGTLYAVSSTGLYTINTSTAAATFVGNLNTGGGLAVALAIDGAGVGYTYDLVDDGFYTINLASGASTYVGNIGFDANFGQGMAWDEATNTVYMTAFNASTFQAEFRSVNLSTGNTTMLGAINSPTLTQIAWVSYISEGGGGTGEDCEVSYAGTFQDGFGYLTQNTVANDFPVAANTVMSVDQVQLRTFGNMTSANVSFYADNSGSPGAQIGTTVNVVPTSQTFVNVTFGFNTYDTVLDLPAPVALDGGASGAIFWVGINTIDGPEGTGGYWEMSDTFNNALTYYSGDGGASWQVNAFGQDGAFSVRGTCQAPEEPVDGCLDTPNGQWGSLTPACIGIPEVVTSNGWFGEYSLVTVTTGTQYIFTTDVPTAFITIANEAGDTAFAVGTGSVTWTSTVSGPIRFITHENDDCLSSTNWVVRMVQCGEPIVIEEPNFPCYFGDGLASNGPEDGLNVSTGASFRTADDFTVAEPFTVKQVRINVLSMTPIVNTALNFRSNNSGTPGNIVETVTMAPSNSRIVGSGFGYNLYELTFDLATFIELDPGTYWFEPHVTSQDGSGSVFWEASSTGTTGAISQQSSDGGATWSPNSYGYQQVFFVAGQCGDSTGEGCSVEYVGTMQDGIGNLQTLQIANDFPVPALTQMTIEQISMRIFADIGTGNLYIYKDNGGMPGDLVDDALGVTPTSKTFVANVFGYNVYDVVFDLPTPIIIETGAAAELFWVGLMTSAGSEGGSNFWEAADINTNGLAMVSTDGGFTWAANSFGQDSAFKVAGECATLGLSDMTSYDFAYYPNPAKDILNITSKKSVESVQVFNLAGQEVLANGKVMNGQINISALSQGTYVFRVTLQGGQVETFKIIKK
jgi:hypothetical protein